jgi:hypothetical protein
MFSPERQREIFMKSTAEKTEAATGRGKCFSAIEGLESSPWSRTPLLVAHGDAWGEVLK